MSRQTKVFIKQFSPYRKRYTSLYPSKNNEQKWYHYDRFLSESLIESALTGEQTIGFFQSTKTKILGIDIDDHQGKGMNYLSNLYYLVWQKLGARPSMLVKSPRGLHLYYFFKELVPTKIITRFANERLAEFKNCEVKPTLTESLRIPVVKNCINVETLEPLNKRVLHSILNTSTIYDSREFFFEEFQNLFDSTTSQLVKGFSVSNAVLKEIEQLEREYLPKGFLPNKTNNQLMQLELIYRTKGLSLNEAVDRCRFIVDEKSPLYGGELKNNPKRIYSRFKSMYEKNLDHEQSELHKAKVTTEDRYKELIEYIISKSPFTKHRESAIRSFLIKLLEWKEFQDRILMDKGELAYWDYLYPFYQFNRMRGYYPFPSGLLRKWNHRYYEIVSFLNDIEFMSGTPFSYSPSRSICKYYSLNIELHTGGTMDAVQVG